MYALERLRFEVIEAISGLTGLGRGEIENILEKPPEGIGADFAFPCFALSRKERKNPVEIAKDVAGRIKPSGLVGKVENKGPYVNFFADWKKTGTLVLEEILKSKGPYGKLPKSGRKIVLEYGQPNTHKSLHLGHVRNMAFSESLCRILEFSRQKVVRANYQGDIGPHIARCLWGLLNLGLKEPERGKGKWLGTVYEEANSRINGNEKLEKEAYEINKKLYAREKAIAALWKKTRKWSLDYLETVYKDFGIIYDRYYFESEVEGPGMKFASELVKEGIAKVSEGAIVMDLKKKGLGTLVLVTKENTPLYSIKDMILAELKEKEHHPDEMIIITGAEQKGYFEQLIASLEAINPEVAKKEKHIAYELVNTAEGKMSSRAGNVVSYEELKEKVMEETLKISKEKTSTNFPEKVASAVGLGSIKYDMIKVSPEKTILFDWKSALSFEGNNAPYIQYTHARACSILAKAGAKPARPPKAALDLEDEISLVKKLGEFPEAVSHAARDCRPHYIANYLYELASLFNDFYQKVPVLKSEMAERESRLAIVEAAKRVLFSGLDLLGIEAPEKM